MALTVAIPITSDEQSALQAKAVLLGVSVDSLLRKAVLQVIGAAPEVLSRIKPEPLSLAQWEKEFDEWLDGQPGMPTLSDAAISREQIYTREDEWR